MKCKYLLGLSMLFILMMPGISAAETKKTSASTVESEETYKIDDYIIKDNKLTCDTSIDKRNKVTIHEAGQILRNQEILLSVLFSFSGEAKEMKDDYIKHKLKESFFALSTRGYYLMADSSFDQMKEVSTLKQDHLYRAYFIFKNIFLPENLLALLCIR